ncbi:MAG TPA: 7-cyano-7-deazaguanine synthase QueC [Kofleriaceae bacterium]|nr:7-cyano-7-deazaguanine synthase QueC [Kofleriaceae bacterium]
MTAPTDATIPPTTPSPQDRQPAAIVLLSGGLDSTTALAIARDQGFSCHALTIAYGQLHACELDAATRVAKTLGAASHRVYELDLRPLARSALTSDAITVPKHRAIADIGAPGDVPPTYVPARNTIFLGLALAYAETLGASDIFIGVNVLDASGYPDCSPAFIAAFEALAAEATRAGKSGQPIRIRAPLIELSKADIIRRGSALGIDYGMTHSCYDPGPGDGACGGCDACLLRKKGFTEAGIADPTRYEPR